MLNQSAEYALRATLFMAHNGAAHSYKATAIATALNLPQNYLSKILHELVRARVLKSERGPTGGYCLAVPPSKLTIDRVIAPFQEVEPDKQCLLGNRRCDRENPCQAHHAWAQIKNALVSRLKSTTLASMLAHTDDTSKLLTLTEVA